MKEYWKKEVVFLPALEGYEKIQLKIILLLSSSATEQLPILENIV
jgi:hypothetical protein